MWLEIHKTQSQYLFQKILKTEPFRIFEKLCHLNLLNMILNENSRNFYFLIANPPHIFLGKFLILTYSQNILNQSDCRIFQFSVLRKQLSYKANFFLATRYS